MNGLTLPAPSMPVPIRLHNLLICRPAPNLMQQQANAWPKLSCGITQSHINDLLRWLSKFFLDAPVDIAAARAFGHLAHVYTDQGVIPRPDSA
jgi:hypothetical protein